MLTSAAGEFVAFGYEAEQRYSEALEDDDDERDDLALFRHFKMRLMAAEVRANNLSIYNPAHVYTAESEVKI